MQQTAVFIVGQVMLRAIAAQQVGQGLQRQAGSAQQVAMVDGSFQNAAGVMHGPPPALPERGLWPWLRCNAEGGRTGTNQSAGQPGPGHGRQQRGCWTDCGCVSWV